MKLRISHKKAQDESRDISRSNFPLGAFGKCLFISQRNVHGARLFRMLLHRFRSSVRVFLPFFRFFFFFEKPRRPDVNMVLMGKRFAEEASLTSALR